LRSRSRATTDGTASGLVAPGRSTFFDRAAIRTSSPWSHEHRPGSVPQAHARRTTDELAPRDRLTPGERSARTRYSSWSGALAAATRPAASFALLSAPCRVGDGLGAFAGIVRSRTGSARMTSTLADLDRAVRAAPPAVQPAAQRGSPASHFYAIADDCPTSEPDGPAPPPAMAAPPGAASAAPNTGTGKSPPPPPRTRPRDRMIAAAASKMAAMP
jgi:hypothetical protein